VAVSYIWIVKIAEEMEADSDIMEVNQGVVAMVKDKIA
jgi:hypothetical protein